MRFLVVGLVLFFVAAILSGCGDEHAEATEARKAKTAADIQAQLPADCYFKDLGVYRPNSYTTLHVAMVNCESKAVNTLNSTTTGKSPRRVIAPFFEDAK